MNMNTPREAIRRSIVHVLAACVVTGACAGRSGPASGAASPSPDPVHAGDAIQIDTTARWVHVQMAWLDEAAHGWANDSLRTVLLAMARADQDVRQNLTAERMADTAFLRRMTRVDSANASQLRGIIARFGWPTKSMVGAQGASAAWLIVQHSDELQEEGERLMLAAAAGEVSPSDLAMLVDRRLVAQGRPQRYGSQLKPLQPGETAMSFYPIENMDGLEQRRADAGLMPLADYIRLLQSMYHMKVLPPE